MSDIKYVKATPEAHEAIKTAATMLADEFKKQAKAAGIPIRERRKGRNVPGMKEALDCLLDQKWSELSIENRAWWYVRSMIEKARGVQV